MLKVALSQGIEADIVQYARVCKQAVFIGFEVLRAAAVQFLFHTEQVAPAAARFFHDSVELCFKFFFRSPQHAFGHDRRLGDFHDVGRSVGVGDLCLCPYLKGEYGYAVLDLEFLRFFADFNFQVIGNLVSVFINGNVAVSEVRVRVCKIKCQRFVRVQRFRPLPAVK